MAANLVSDETEVVERVGVVWLDRQDLTIKRLGVGQPPFVLTLEREFEGLGEGHGG
jgi:hypothetical protein